MDRWLEFLATASRPTLHPAGDRAITSVIRPSIAADAYVGQLWTVPIDGGEPRRITRGFRDTAPAFSPNGELIAFVRATPGAPGQLMVMDATGGEAVQVTDQPLGIGEFVWSPNSSSIAFTARVPEQGRYGTVEEIGAGAEAPRRFSSLRYRSNGVGYTPDRRLQVFLVEAPDVTDEPVIQPIPDATGTTPDAPSVVPPVVQVTTGDWDSVCPRFSPDGATITVISARHGGRDVDLLEQLYSYALDDLSADPIRTDVGQLSIARIAYTNDGRVLAIAQDVGPTGRDFVAKHAGLYRVGADGAPTRLTDANTVDLTESDITVLEDGSALVQNRSRGSLELVRVSPDGDIDRLGTGDRVVAGVDAVGSTIVVSFSDATRPGDLGLVAADGIRPLTDFAADLRDAGVRMPAEHVIVARDGSEVHGWVVKPEGEGPFPVLLNIHGGPWAQYTGSFFDEAQVYTSAGYAVVMCNPRGSAGYGHEHGRAVRQAMGTVDFTDVIDFFDGVVDADAELDGSRAGVMGGSYGGYLTAWTIAHDHRFAAAIVERGFLDPLAFAGTSDIGDFFGDEYTGTEPELIARQSPQAVVDRVRTPTLVLHSEDDLRCPLGQAERYYASLKRGGVESEIVIFPGENHELTRSGRPRHRAQRFEIILDWWARYLPVNA